MSGTNRAVDRPVDLAVVGAGIVGLGHALAAHKRGLSVVVVDRSTGLNGATIRNFGHIATTAHAGEIETYARRSRELWIDLARRAGFWLRPSGTLVVARHHDEMSVLSELGAHDRRRLLSAEQVSEIAPVVGAIGGMRCPDDLQVDPREAGVSIATWLAEQGVDFRWRTAACGVEPGVLHTARGEIHAEAIVVAVNHDVDELFPTVAECHGVRRCALDMAATDGVGLSIPLLTGSSMLRYAAFATMPSAADVRSRYAVEHPEQIAHDINQMYTERPDGSLLVGDTHTTDVTVAPFQDEAGFELLERLGAELFGRRLTVRQRWQGVYASAPGAFLRAEVGDGVRVIGVTTGVGMTTGLGLADSVIEELFGAQ